MKTNTALCLVLVVALFAPRAGADQAQWLSKEAAARADAAVEYGAALRHYCKPCGDKVYRAAEVMTKEIVPIEGEEQVEFWINGEAIDLAYVYIERAGLWANLAMAIELKVEAVPAELPAEIPAGLPDFDRFKFAGTIDGSLPVVLELSKYGDTLNGAYHYSHSAQSLTLEGKVDQMGVFTLTETVAEKTTGSFRGRFTGVGTGIEGEWTSADGSKKLPVLAARIAIHGDESGGLSCFTQATSTHLDFPVFLPAYSLAHVAINRTIQAKIRGAYLEYVQQFIEAAAMSEKGMQSGALYPEEMEETINIGDHQIVYASETCVSVRFITYLFQGGAHGNTHTEMVNLRIMQDTVKEIVLKDLLKPGAAALTALSDFVLAKLKQQEASGVVSGATTALSLEEMGAFSLSPRGIRIYFDPYAVASYAEGAFEVFVPFGELPEVFNPDALQGIVPPPVSS